RVEHRRRARRRSAARVGLPALGSGGVPHGQPLHRRNRRGRLVARCRGHAADPRSARARAHVGPRCRGALHRWRAAARLNCAPRRTMSLEAPATPSPAGLAPTHARRGVVWFAVTLAAITYVDRVCIAQAAPFMQRDLGLTAAQMGLAFSAFAVAYALFEIPGGWL